MHDILNLSPRTTLLPLAAATLAAVLAVLAATAPAEGGGVAPPSAEAIAGAVTPDGPAGAPAAGPLAWGPFQHLQPDEGVATRWAGFGTRAAFTWAPAGFWQDVWCILTGDCRLGFGGRVSIEGAG